HNFAMAYVKNSNLQACQDGFIDKVPGHREVGGYAANRHIIDNTSTAGLGTHAKKMAEISKPASMFLLMDAGGYQEDCYNVQRPRTPHFYIPGATLNRNVTNWAAATGAPFAQRDAVSGRHSDTRVMVCFCDGHTRAIRADDVVGNAAAWTEPQWGAPYPSAGAAAQCAQTLP